MATRFQMLGRCVMAFTALVPAGIAIVQNAIAEEASVVVSAPEIGAPTTVIEARDRAKLLHETIRGTLQVVHRDLFDEDGFAIPSRSFEDVFEELGRSYEIQVKWLIVNTDVLNTDHVAESDFEKLAVKSLAKGNRSFEQSDEGKFQYAGAIKLGTQCLKCHVKRRTSNDDRTAGLVITMPIGGGINH